jgi:hypothetical protein
MVTGKYSHCDLRHFVVTGKYSHCDLRHFMVTGKYSHCDLRHFVVTGKYSHCVKVIEGSLQEIYVKCAALKIISCCHIN